MASSGGISDQLFVSVKLESPHLAELDLAPHLFGSHPVAGSWDPCKAVSSGSPLACVMCARSGFLIRFVFFSTQLPLERAATAVWEFSCVVPSQHGKLVDLIVKFNNFAGPQRSLFLHSEVWDRKSAIRAMMLGCACTDISGIALCYF
jgi:6-phosphofructo-2-kinase / fructose-2,6-biphosphatase 3